MESLLNKNDRKVLLSNFLSLFFLQIANYIIPLLTFPYIVKTIGVEQFGILAFVTAVISYFNILVDYGFNLTATNMIAINKSNQKKIIEIFSSIMIIKFLFIIVSLLILFLLFTFFDSFYEYRTIYLLTFGTIIGNALFPIWLFQGMEKMKHITIITVFSRIIFLLLVFIFLNNSKDYYMVPLFNAATAVLAGIFALVYVKYNLGIKFQLQNYKILHFYLSDGWHIFKTYLFVSLYTKTNIILLGIFTNNTIVGYYSIIEKIVNIVSNIFTPVNQSIYPYISRLYISSKGKFYKFYKYVSLGYLAVSVVLLIFMTLFKVEIIELVSGNINSNLLSLYDILKYLILTFPFGAYFASIMNILSLKKEISYIIMKASFINIALAPIAIIYFEGVGLAVATLIVQVFIMLSYYLKIKEKYVKY